MKRVMLIWWVVLGLTMQPLSDQLCNTPPIVQTTLAAASSFLPDAPRGVAALGQISSLPALQDDSIVKEVSSNDPTGGNVDVFNYLYRDAAENYVILDEQGPAIIYNSWMTTLPGGGLPGGNIRFYFDGETKASLSMPTSNFFDGSTAPFKPPLSYAAKVGNADNCLKCHSTFYNYYPIAYQKSLKITVENVPGYYHFFLRKYNNSVGIQSYSGKENLETVRQQWSNLGRDPKQSPNQAIVSGQEKLTNNSQPVTIYTGIIPGSISQVALRPDKITPDVLQNLRVVIYWDDAINPAVDVPVGFFFGGGTSLRPFQSLLTGMPETGLWYNYFPMPFWKNATIQLVNRSTTPLLVNYEVKANPAVYNPGRTGYFNVTYTAAAQTRVGQDWSLLKVTGRGELVGVVMSTALTGGSDNWWEGDERFYLDGSRYPQILGTGSEDFFNLAYEPTSFWISPLSGSTSESTKNDGSPDRAMSWYRWFLGDKISFHSSISAGIEVGPTNNLSANDRRSAAFWYGLPETQSNLSDSLDIGKAADQQAHSYIVQGQNWSGNRTYSYPGEAQNVPFGDDGVAFKGQSDFRVKVRPDAKAVVLRRRLTTNVANQVADVYVDGKLAGRWQEMGGKTPGDWRDSEFMLPSNLTRGKSQLNITVKFVSSAADWNEFYYEVLSLGSTTFKSMACP